MHCTDACDSIALGLWRGTLFGWAGTDLNPGGTTLREDRGIFEASCSREIQRLRCVGSFATVSAAFCAGRRHCANSVSAATRRLPSLRGARVSSLPCLSTPSRRELGQEFAEATPRVTCSRLEELFGCADVRNASLCYSAIECTHILDVNWRRVRFTSCIGASRCAVAAQSLALCILRL